MAAAALASALALAAAALASAFALAAAAFSALAAADSSFAFAFASAFAAFSSAFAAACSAFASAFACALAFLVFGCGGSSGGGLLVEDDEASTSASSICFRMSSDPTAPVCLTMSIYGRINILTFFKEIRCPVPINPNMERLSRLNMAPISARNASGPFLVENTALCFSISARSSDNASSCSGATGIGIRGFSPSSDEETDMAGDFAAGAVSSVLAALLFGVGVAMSRDLILCFGLAAFGGDGGSGPGAGTTGIGSGSGVFFLLIVSYNPFKTLRALDLLLSLAVSAAAAAGGGGGGGGG